MATTLVGVLRHYRSAREVLEGVEAVLGEVPSPRSAPLERVLEILNDGRHYAASAIYLDGAGGRQAAALLGGTLGQSAETLAVPIKIAGRALGELLVEKEPQRPLGGDDRVLLKEVAARLARFLTGGGKHILVRSLRFGTQPGKPMSAGR